MRKFRHVLAVILAAAMVVTPVKAPVFATEEVVKLQDEVRATGEDGIEENETSEFEVEETVAGDENLIAVQSESEEENRDEIIGEEKTEEVAPADSDASDIEEDREQDVAGDDTVDGIESEMEDDSLLDNAEVIEDVEEEVEENFFYRDLTVQEENAKQALSGDLATLNSASESDYVPNEVFALVDSEEEALEIAKAYEAATGLDVTLEDYAYGVAEYRLEGKVKPANGMDAGLSTMSRVECALTIASDVENDLPPVYVNFLHYADSATDPLAVDKDNYYWQWYHDIIGDKFVWDDLDNNAEVKERLSNIAVAVIDSGINYNHEDFAGVVVRHTSTITSEKSTKDTVGDDHGHGTNCSGLIAEAANDKGGRGVAAGVKIKSYRALKKDGNGATGDTADIIKAVNAVVEEKDNYGAETKVLSMSIGGTWYSGAYDTAIQKVREAGILTVCSAGNSYTTSTQYPAGFRNTLCVAALGQDLEKSSYSNYGAYVDLGAPGGDQYGYGQNLYAPSNTNNSSYDNGMMGTSQATPLVSGTAALVFAYNPSFTAGAVENRIISTAMKTKAKFYIGAGCVDTAAAVGIEKTPDIAVTDIDGVTVQNNQKFNNRAQLKLEVGDGCTAYYAVDKGAYQEYTGDFTVTGNGKHTIKAYQTKYEKVSSTLTITINVDDTVITRVGFDNMLQMFVVNEDVLNRAYISTLAVGKSLSLKPNFEPLKTKNKNVTYESSDTDILEVNTKGSVKAKAVGTATITVKSVADPSLYCTAEITVQPLATAVLFDEESQNLTMTQGETTVLHSTVTPEEASQMVYYTSNKPKVVSITNKGVVTATGSGTATITAMAADGSGKKTTTKITVTSPVTSITAKANTAVVDSIGLVGRDVYAIGKGGTAQITPTLNGGKAVDNKKVKYEVDSSSAGASYVTVNSKGAVKNIGGFDEACNVTIIVSSEQNPEIRTTVAFKLYPEAAKLMVPYYNYPYQAPSDIYCYDEVWLSNGGWYDYDYDYDERACPIVEYTVKGNCGTYYPNEWKYSAYKGGSVTITATVNDGTKAKKSITKKVAAVYLDKRQAISNSTMSPVLVKGQSITFKAENLSGYSFVLSTSGATKNAHLQVSSEKTVKCINSPSKKTEYTVYLYKKYSRYYPAYCESVSTVTVYPTAATGISLGEDDKKTITLKKGQHKVLNAELSGDGSHCQDLSYFKSSNTKVAMVSEDGTVTAIAPGTATITVMSPDRAVKTNCKITVPKN